MMTNTARGHAGGSSGLVWMLLNAALFGYFGFFLIWPNTVDGAPNWISIVLMWTVRTTAIAFAVAAGLVFIHKLLANLLYSAVGLASAVLFGVVILWHLTTDAHAPISPVLLLIFALLNGYGSFMELRELAAMRRMQATLSD